MRSCCRTNFGCGAVGLGFGERGPTAVGEGLAIAEAEGTEFVARTELVAARTEPVAGTELAAGAGPPPVQAPSRSPAHAPAVSRARTTTRPAEWTRVPGPPGAR
ncbi:MAG: hypothetical protein QOG52_931 [Frankiaceae bacterium]|nr:hypothetical protein [Frankiaceae bacterium]